MRPALVLAVALAALAGARGAREAAVATRAAELADEPFAPSPDTAALVSIGYRELTADLLYARLRTYLGGGDSTADGIAALVEAIAALDPRYRRIYDFGARAMTIAQRGVDQRTYLRALAVLDQGMREFPSDWRIPYAAGQIYMLDLQTTDPAQRRAWDERSAQLLESATRKPNAPGNAALAVAHLRTRLGEHQRAIDGLREMLLVTGDSAARKVLIDKLAELERTEATEIAAELLEQRRRFDTAWKRARPALPASMYVLLGPPPPPWIDMAELATGGRGAIEAPIERLPPPADP